MKNVTVYDPAMCCSTGICGAEVDQKLVDFAADLDWLKTMGVAVTRINLSQEPAAFAANDKVRSVLASAGVDGLPVIMIEEQLHSSGLYPNRGELAEMAGVAYKAPAAKGADTGCCGGAAKSDEKSTGCC